MKKILLTLIIGIGVAGIANATLWDFYNGNLPSVSDRASEATECDISDYTGTYDQNIKLENCLREKAFLGATTSTAPTPAPSLYRNQTWTGVNTYTSSTISSGNNTWTGTNTFSGTTSLATTTLGSTVIDNVTINNTTTTFNNVIVNGTLISSSTNLISGTELISSADTERNTNQAAYTKLKEIRMNVDATSLNIYFEMQRGAGGGSTQCSRAYKNGVALGAELCTNTNDGAWENQNASYTGFRKGDLLQLYAKTSNPSYVTIVKNFRIYADTYSTVITN